MAIHSVDDLARELDPNLTDKQREIVLYCLFVKMSQRECLIHQIFKPEKVSDADYPGVGADLPRIVDVGL